MALYIADMCPSRGGEGWRRLVLSCAAPPVTVARLAKALRRLERGVAPDEFARAYAGRWVVWRAERRSTVEVVTEGVRRRGLRDLVSLTFAKTPADDALDRLEEIVAKAVADSVEAAASSGVLEPALLDAVESSGEALATLRLTKSDLSRG